MMSYDDVESFIESLEKNAEKQLKLAKILRDHLKRCDLFSITSEEELKGMRIASSGSDARFLHSSTERIITASTSGTIHNRDAAKKRDIVNFMRAHEQKVLNTNQQQLHS